MEAVFLNEERSESRGASIPGYGDPSSPRPAQFKSNGPSAWHQEPIRKMENESNDSRPQILIVDDDDSVTSSIYDHLAGCKNFQCLQIGYSEAFIRAHQHAGDLFVVNLVKDSQRAFDFCRAIRQSSNVPVIVYAPQADDIDEVLSFELGADEFFMRFPTARILSARISSLLRRSIQPKSETVARFLPTVLEFEGLVLDRSSFVGRLDGKLLRLSESEFRLLSLLAERPNELILHQEIEDALLAWGMTAGVKAIHHRIYRINAELRNANPNSVSVRNLKRSGYCLVYRPAKL